MSREQHCQNLIQTQQEKDDMKESLLPLCEF